MSKLSFAQIIEAYTMYAKKENLPSVKQNDIINGIVSECMKVGWLTKRGRDRYEIDKKTGSPKPRENYIMGIRIVKKEEIGLTDQTDNEHTEKKIDRTYAVACSAGNF
jgi:hypothetical protein